MPHSQGRYGLRQRTPIANTGGRVNHRLRPNVKCSPKTALIGERFGYYPITHAEAHDIPFGRDFRFAMRGSCLVATDPDLIRDSQLAWIEDSFRELPGSTDELFQRLWTEQRIGYIDSPPDAVDEYGARLICAALARSEPLFIALPDQLPRRPALLFATALIRDWMNIINLASHHGTLATQPVLYLGTTIGIREQLAQVKVDKRTWDLGDVFQPRHLAHDGRPRNQKTATREASSIPVVYTAYDPAMPATLIESIRPAWLAIDCADANQTDWLAEALATAKRLGVPVLAWGQNPLSNSIEGFAEYGLVWRWPYRPRTRSSNAGPDSGARLTIRSLFAQDSITTLQPLILNAGNVDPIASRLQDAGRELWHARRLGTGRLTADAVAVHIRLLRALELLCVPVDTHDAEAPNHWGIRSFARLLGDCQRFREACQRVSPEIVRHLEPAATDLEFVLNEAHSSGPPLWHALTNICVIDPPNGQARIIVIQSRAAKQLFILSLLARFNVSEDDLKTLRTQVLSLDELGRLWRLRDHTLDESTKLFASDPTLAWSPLFVGVPTYRAYPKLSPVFAQGHAEFLVYPHQQYVLALRLEQVISNLDYNVSREAATIAKLRNCSAPDPFDDAPTRFAVLPPQYLDLSAARSETPVQNLSAWQPADAAEELSALFADENEADDSDESLADTEGGAEQSDRDGWCATGIRLEFTGEWHALFAPDEQLNVVLRGASGHHSEARYVRSVRPGDQVVLIHGQRRQSMYDLIISRVHRHPAIELHLALIHRWQDDAIAAFEDWRGNGGTVDTLLARLQLLGSTLISSLTIRNWLTRRTIAPDDREDLRRLADALNLTFVQEHYRRIDKAAARLRGLHRGLAIRINRWLEQQASGTVATNDNEVFDQELGLRFADFRDSLLFLEVRATREVEGPFLRIHLGKLERVTS